MQPSASHDDFLNEKNLKHQLHKMMRSARKEKHEIHHKLRRRLRQVKKQEVATRLATWLPSEAGGSMAEGGSGGGGRSGGGGGGGGIPAGGLSGSVNLSVSRRLSTEEIEQCRIETLEKLRKEKKTLTTQLQGNKIEEYFDILDESHRKGQHKVEGRRVRAQSAVSKRDRRKAVERRPLAVHEVTWKMKTNAGNIIMRPFVGNGPSPPSDMPVLKEGADIWPVIPERTGAGRLPGQPSWYRTQNGNDFGDQKLKNFPKHYKKIVLRNKKVKKQKDEIQRMVEERKRALDEARALNTKPQRPWSAAGGGRVFSMLTSIRPPTSLERQKMAALPSRALAGHTVNGNPKWKCR